MAPVSFALIGCGRIAKNHLEAMAGHAGIILHSVCDIIPHKMKAAVGYYEQALQKAGRLAPSPAMVEDYHQILESPDIDAVAICTESGNHAAIALAALSARKNVLVEKPLALSSTDAEAMITAAEKNGLLLGVCHQNRFNPAVQFLRKELEAGKFGKLIHGVASIRWTRDENYYRQAPWRGTWAQDGGTLMNQCIHNIDLLQWMMGDVERVYAETDTFLRPIEGEDAGVATIRFKNGALGIVEGSACVYPKNLEETLSIFGSHATVCLGGLAVNTVEHAAFSDGVADEEVAATSASTEIDSVYGKGHHPLYRNFVAAMRGEERLLVDGVEGRKALDIVLAIYKSVRTGAPVQFPLGEYSTLTDLEVR